MAPEAVQRAIEVKRQHERELLQKPNVVGVGVGFRTRGGRPTNQVCIVVSVKRKLPPARLPPGGLIPSLLDGVPVDVVETGEIRAS